MPDTMRAELERLIPTHYSLDVNPYGFAVGAGPVRWRVVVSTDDPETGKLLGTGPTESAALADAIETVKGWTR